MFVKLEAYHDGEYWCARGIGVSVFTQGDTLDALYLNAQEAIALHFDDELRRGEKIKIQLTMEVEIKGKADVDKSKGGASLLDSEELNRRKSLVERIFAMREELPALDITTAELVRLAREERKWFYESQ